jgi:hypothetical protein
MEHLLLPQDREPLNIEVPYVSNDAPAYCGRGLLDFQQFPILHGYRRTKAPILSLVELLGYPAQRPAGFVQSWLYFGLLREVLGPNIWGEAEREQNFISSQSHPEGQRLLTSSALGPLLKQKERSLKSWIWHSKAAKLERDRIREILVFAADQCQAFDRDCEILSWSEIMLSIRILIDSLTHLMYCESGSRWHQRHFEGSSGPNIMSRGSVRVVYDRLKGRHGWCNHQVKRMCRETHSAIALVYLATLRRHPATWIDHSRCDEAEYCAAYNINQEFKGVHVSTDCRCMHIQAPEEDMLAILRNGGFPILRCTTDRAGNITLKYHRATLKTSYTAISHLWADGLANHEGNSLPRCQLTRLIERVADIECSTSPLQKVWHKTPWRRRVDMWLDVYCVPIPRVPATFAIPNGQEVTNETQKLEDQIELKDIHIVDNVQSPEEKQRLEEALELEEGRRLAKIEKDERIRKLEETQRQRLKADALRKMTATYAWAKNVLVLDHELSFVTSGHDELEVRGRIAICGWNSRYWTFQEHCLSRDTFFQTKDGPRREFQGRHPFPLKRQNKESLYETLHRDLFHAARVIQIETGAARPCVIEEQQSQSATNTSLFKDIWEALVDRNTTKLTDALGIFAALLGTDPSGILSLSIEEQMKAILKSQTSLPLDILLANAPRHGSDDNWIPITPKSVVLDFNAHTIMKDDNCFWLPRTGSAGSCQVQYCTSEGLHPEGWILDIDGEDIWGSQTGIEYEIRPHDSLAAAQAVKGFVGEFSVILLLQYQSNYADTGLRAGNGACLIVPSQLYSTKVRYGFSLSWSEVGLDEEATLRKQKLRRYRTSRMSSSSRCRLALLCSGFHDICSI